jgi:hypothetical protein
VLDPVTEIETSPERSSPGSQIAKVEKALWLVGPMSPSRVVRQRRSQKHAIRLSSSYSLISRFVTLKSDDLEEISLAVLLREKIPTSSAKS